MWRKLKLPDLDDGKYTLFEDSTPLANFGYRAYRSTKVDNRPDVVDDSFIHNDSAIISLSFMESAIVNASASLTMAGASIILLSAF